MNRRFQHLRQTQLDRALTPFGTTPQRPQKGWLRAVREALGLSAADVANTLGTSRHLPAQLEKSEAEDRITLRSLRAAANAMDCDLVYALVPRAGSLSELAERRTRAAAQRDVQRVEHTMLLEDQAVGRVAEAVTEETRRRLKKRSH